MKIIFWGASVTQQSGMSGYFEQIKFLFKNSENIIFDRFGFGGSTFDDVGFYCIDKILNSQPNVCFIEFSTTFSVNFDIAKHNQFIRTLIINKIIPIYLILPRVHNIQGLPCIDQQYEFHQNFNIPILDLREEFVSLVELTEYFRDGVHTTDKAASLIAKRIKNLIFDKIISFDFESLILPNEIIHIPIHRFVIEKKEAEKGVRIYFDLENLKKNDYFELFFQLKIGPSSNNLIAMINDNLIHTSPIFDQWTHYEREAYKPAISNKLNPDYNRVYGLQPVSLEVFYDKLLENKFIDFYPSSIPINKPFDHINCSNPSLFFFR